MGMNGLGLCGVPFHFKGKVEYGLNRTFRTTIMAGHSKWANIKRQKARVDAKKGQVFTKISREIIVAARTGVPDPEGNFQLRFAIEKAKSAGVPKENIERAIAKGCGKFGNESALEAVRYEGYGSGGIAVLIEAFTDNRNRTAADLRSAFSKNGGNLGETGCVSWMFAQKGVATIVSAAIDEEMLLDVSLEAEADSYEILTDEDHPGAEIFTPLEQLESLVQILKFRGYSIRGAELRWIPSNTVEVTDPDQARSILKLMDALEDLEDVQTVTANFEMTEELATELLGP